MQKEKAGNKGILSVVVVVLQRASKRLVKEEEEESKKGTFPEMQEHYSISFKEEFANI